MRQAFFLLLEPRRIVAFPRDAVAAVELEYPAGHVVQEVTIMGNRNDRTRVLVEKTLQPGDGFRIEVVRRLVE